MTDADIIKRLRQFAAQPFGLKRRDVTDRFDSKPRARARAMLDKMIADGEFVVADPADRYPRYFRTTAAAQAWLAGGKSDPVHARGRRGRTKAVPQPKAVPGYVWREKKAADPATVVGLDKAPVKCWSPDRDFRHQVLRGEAARVVDASQCRPWAVAAAAQIGARS
jgi:hypothetical protein